MKVCYLISLIIVIPLTSLAPQDAEEEAIQKAVEQTYINPLYLGGSLDAIRDGLHEDFEMFVYVRGKFSKRSKEQWLKRLEEVRNRPKNPNAPKPTNTFKFAMIDYTGPTAMVKLEVYREGKLNFTDYLTLYKIEGQWQLLSKFFTWHGEM